jgi:outer membrane protein OmpA-like peptidoglycan-associated protein
MNKPAIAHLANAALAVALSVSAASLLQAQEIRGFINGEKTSVKGVIESRNGDLMTIRTQKNALATIQILDETQVESTVGWGKGKLFRTKKTNLTVLMPGLAVNVSGEGNADGQLAAKKISFNPKDLETAAAIKSGTAGLAASQQQTQEDVKANQAGIAENKAGIDANKQAIAETQETQRSDFNKLDTRVSDLDDYDVKTTVVVNFASGSTALAAADKQELDDFAKQALGIRGYMVQVQRLRRFKRERGTQSKTQPGTRKQGRRIPDAERKYPFAEVVDAARLWHREARGRERNRRRTC